MEYTSQDTLRHTMRDTARGAMKGATSVQRAMRTQGDFRIEEPECRRTVRVSRWLPVGAGGRRQAAGVLCESRFCSSRRCLRRSRRSGVWSGGSFSMSEAFNSAGTGKQGQSLGIAGPCEGSPRSSHVHLLPVGAKPACSLGSVFGGRAAPPRPRPRGCLPRRCPRRLTSGDRAVRWRAYPWPE